MLILQGKTVRHREINNMFTIAQMGEQDLDSGCLILDYTQSCRRVKHRTSNIFLSLAYFKSVIQRNDEPLQITGITLKGYPFGQEIYIYKGTLY